MNLAIKELAVLLCCCLSILNLFPLTITNIFLCDIFYICFAHENMKKLPSKVGYFRKVAEIFPYCPDCPNGPQLQIHLRNLVMQPSLYISRVVLVCRARAEVDLNKSTTEASSSYLSPLHFPSLLLESEY